MGELHTLFKCAVAYFLDANLAITAHVLHLFRKLHFHGLDAAFQLGNNPLKVLFFLGESLAPLFGSFSHLPFPLLPFLLHPALELRLLRIAALLDKIDSLLAPSSHLLNLNSGLPLHLLHLRLQMADSIGV